MIKSIKVHGGTSETRSIDALNGFQGEMKKLTKKDLDALKKSILKEGLLTPFAIWGDYILDGHGRKKALLSLRDDGYSIPMIPVIVIESDTRQGAAEKLLALSSRFHKTTTEGMREFLGSEGLSVDILSDFSIDIRKSLRDEGLLDTTLELDDEESEEGKEYSYLVFATDDKVIDLLNAIRGLGLQFEEV